MTILTHEHVIRLKTVGIDLATVFVENDVSKKFP
jgi:hypothetical protein